MLIDKILESKLTKNERDLNLCIIAFSMLLSATIQVLMIVLTRALDQPHFEKFLNLLIFAPIAFVIGMLIFVFQYHRIKTRINQESKI